MQQSEEATEVPPVPLPEHVRASLRKYQKLTTMTCLECGYAGLMGVKKSTKPWYLSWWMIVVYATVLAPTFGWGFILAFALGVLADLFAKQHVTECPNCGTELTSRQHVL